jgi:hypothetical protein
MRKFTWVLLIINALFLIWVISALAGGGSAVEDCSNLAKQAKDMCEAGNAGTAVGTGLGVFIIVAFWAFVDVILGVIWLVTNKK